MNPREAASVVALIAAAYPQWPASKETVAVYADALGDLAMEDVTAAVRAIIRTDDRWPTVATIRRRVASTNGLLAPSAGVAWSEVCGLAASVGRGSAARFSHPTITAAVTAIGWYNLCNSTNLDTLRAQFTRIYEDGRERHDVELLGRGEGLSDDRRRLANPPGGTGPTVERTSDWES